jgi:hypothetical protein
LVSVLVSVAVTVITLGEGLVGYTSGGETVTVVTDVLVTGFGQVLDLVTVISEVITELEEWVAMEVVGYSEVVSEVDDSVSP